MRATKISRPSTSSTGAPTGPSFNVPTAVSSIAVVGDKVYVARARSKARLVGPRRDRPRHRSREVVGPHSCRAARRERQHAVRLRHDRGRRATERPRSRLLGPGRNGESGPPPGLTGTRRYCDDAGTSERSSPDRRNVRGRGRGGAKQPRRLRRAHREAAALASDLGWSGDGHRGVESQDLPRWLLHPRPGKVPSQPRCSDRKPAPAGCLPWRPGLSRSTASASRSATVVSSSAAPSSCRARSRTPGTRIRFTHLAAFSASGPGARIRFASHALNTATGGALSAGGVLAVHGRTLLLAEPSGVAAFSVDGDGRHQLWRTPVRGTVKAFATSGATLYIGGRFSRVSGKARSNLAGLALDRKGALLPFAPAVTQEVGALAPLAASSCTASRALYPRRLGTRHSVRSLRTGRSSPGESTPMAVSTASPPSPAGSPSRGASTGWGRLVIRRPAASDGSTDLLTRRRLPYRLPCAPRRVIATAPHLAANSTAPAGERPLPSAKVRPAAKESPAP